MNDNQFVNLSKNQIMRCIICHSELVPPEFLAMHTRCMKGLIAYHKCNGIITMKKHVEFDHFTLLQKLLEDPTNLAPRFPLDHELTKKRVRMYFHLQFLVFFLLVSSRKMMQFKFFWEDLILFVIKGLVPMEIVESIWF